MKFKEAIAPRSLVTADFCEIPPKTAGVSKKYVVLKPVGYDGKWYVGWWPKGKGSVATDIKISRRTITDTVTMPLRPETVRYFGILEGGQQIKIERIDEDSPSVL